MFVPVYLHHRYEVDSAAKALGGVRIAYYIKDDTQVPYATLSSEVCEVIGAIV